MKRKVLFAVLAAVLFSGCSQETKTAEIYYNLSDISSFAESNECCFISQTYCSDNGNVINKLAATDKDTGETFDVIRNKFVENITADYFCIADNSLYFMKFVDSRGFSLYEVTLDDYRLRQKFFQSSETDYSYLGLKLDNTVRLDKTVIGFFTDSRILYLITDQYEIYRTDFALNSPKCIISDGVYNRNLIFDGKFIYYVNDNLELKAYNTADNNETLLSEDFIFAFDIDGDNLIYSDNSGIYTSDLSGGNKRELIGKSAEKISAKNGKIAFSENNRIYCLSDGNAKEIYNGRIMNFSLMSDGKTVFICTAGHKGLNNNIIDIDTGGLKYGIT